MTWKIFQRIMIALAVALFAACTAVSPPTAIPTPTPPTGELVIYDWPEDIPQDVLDDFTAEFGIHIQYLTYSNQEIAADELRAGKVYGLVVLSNELVARLASEELLAEIDYGQVLNFRNISPNFRDLAYDPQNRHSIPFNWGTVGIMVRPDLLKKPIQHWADLWDPEFTGKIVTWRAAHAVIGAGLKGLGYSINSNSVEEFAAARQRLLALRPRFILMSEEDFTLAAYLIKGEASVALAFARDVLEAQKSDVKIEFILPEEGAMLWGDNFVIPANSPNQAAAHAFLNYLLRPEIGARLVAYNLYPTPNDAALPLIAPAIRNNPIIFPPDDVLKKAEIQLPADPAVWADYDALWNDFLAAGK